MRSMRGIIFALAVFAIMSLASPSFARHPRCFGWGGGFYSNTCYAGFNNPWVDGWGRGYSSFGCAPVYRFCYPQVYAEYYGGCYPGYAGYYGNYSPYGIGYYDPPVFAPAELLYGPLAVRRFLGMSEPGPAAIVPRVVEARRPREASPEYRRRGEQLIAQGDVLFREQKYQQAIERYKTASEMAPDLAEAYWHKGHAYAATKRYELAAASYRRALAIDPDIRRDGFSLAALYGDTAMAKGAHLEAIAGYALERPDSADTFFVLGIFLHYSGEAERAEKFFLRAATLSSPDAAWLAGFVPGAVPVKLDEAEL